MCMHRNESDACEKLMKVNADRRYNQCCNQCWQCMLCEASCTMFNIQRDESGDRALGKGGGGVWGSLRYGKQQRTQDIGSISNDAERS